MSCTHAHNVIGNTDVQCLLHGGTDRFKTGGTPKGTECHVILRRSRSYSGRQTILIYYIKKPRGML